jgi:hexosaminidase
MQTLPAIIPVPVECHAREGAPFVLTPKTRLESDAASAGAGRWFAQWLGLDESQAAAGPGIVLRVEPALVDRVGREGYLLGVSAAGVVIRGAEAAGVFYGLQTLRQLMPPDVEQSKLRTQGGRIPVPAVEIMDRPRFGWRGALLDVSRHFASVAEVKRFIDLLALHKLNVFHWHLVDDQGWRIEIKKYPRLTEVGAWRDSTTVQGAEGEQDGIPHGGFYTQEEIRDVVNYAAERCITVMPEIEVPGHSSAAIAAYPHLGNTDAPGFAPQVQTRWAIFNETYAPKPETLQFLDDVFTEALALFPSTFIHVGGDEALKEQWEKSPTGQAFMAANKLKDGHELQSWFIRRTEGFLAARGRRLIGWDEIQEGGLAPGAAMMAWRDVKWAIEAARLGHDVVMAPTSHTYLDYCEGSEEEEGGAIGAQTTLEKVYAFDPIPAELEPQYRGRVLGAQGQLWRERMPSMARTEWRAFPRLSALAEVVWSPRERRNFADFRARLPWLLARFDRLSVNYRRPRK